MKRVLIIGFLQLFFINWVFGESIQTGQRLWYTKPAEKWLEALPIGNGSLGGMIFGGVDQEHIQFNEESLITGTTQTVGFYQPFGDVYLDFPGLKAENYRRELDLDDAIHRISYLSDGVTYTREYFASYPDKVIVLHLAADKPGKISGKIRLTDAHQGAISVSGNKITATGKLTENQMEYESQMIVLNKGWICYSTNNLMGGPSTWGIHRPGSAWLSQHFREHYAFTGDREFLKNRAYPMLKDVAGYWEDHLVEIDGKLMTPDGWSPEHGPGMVEGDKTPYPGVSYDQQIVYDLFSNCIEAADALGVDTGYRDKITDMQKRLLGPQIGKWGQLQEWKDDVDSPNDHHRHNSHLFAVHPGRQITPLTTPEWAKAAMVSLNARGDISTGWNPARLNHFLVTC